jgi:Amt family ammonium transporter
MKRLDLENKKALNRKTRSHNPVNVILGTCLLWIGWFGFNGGSALGANLRAVSACISTHLAACAGAAMGTLLEYWIISAKQKNKLRKLPAGEKSGEKYKARFSITGFCNGAVAGLVAITPAAGYVRPFLSPSSKRRRIRLTACVIGPGMVRPYIRRGGDRLCRFCNRHS